MIFRFIKHMAWQGMAGVRQICLTRRNPCLSENVRLGEFLLLHAQIRTASEQRSTFVIDTLKCYLFMICNRSRVTFIITDEPCFLLTATLTKLDTELLLLSIE